MSRHVDLLDSREFVCNDSEEELGDDRLLRLVERKRAGMMRAIIPGTKALTP